MYTICMYVCIVIYFIRQSLWYYLMIEIYKLLDNTCYNYHILAIVCMISIISTMKLLLIYSNDGYHQHDHNHHHHSYHNHHHHHHSNHHH